MKRLLYVFAILAIFSSCSDDFEYVFDKTPTERKAEANAKLNSLLTDSEFGWKTTMILNTDGSDDELPVVGDFFVFKFNKNEGANDGIVTVSSRNGSADSEYAIGQETGTTLRFTTPNEILFWLINPTYDKPSGYGADMEYIFMKEEDGKLYFKGKALDSELVLEKASEQDNDLSVVVESKANFLESNNKNFFFLEITGGVADASEETPLYIQIGNPPYAKYFEEDLKQLFYEFIYVVDGKRTRTDAATYVFTNEGIIFSDPLVIGQDTVSKLVYNETSDEWLIADEGVTGKILPADLPHVVIPGLVDLYIDNFFATELGVMLDPWGSCHGPWKDLLSDNMFNYDVPRLTRIRLVSKYVSPDTGEMLGTGILIVGYEDTDFVFIPLDMEKLAENHIKFTRNGDIVGNIEGAIEKLATDESLNAIFDIVCDEAGWLISCDIIPYDGSLYYDCMFYSVTNPANQIEHMGKVD
ncbi:DUF4302 domain-containing protein [Ancylomarina salipaludis]|uniref:DUF4302 domain-containing protein n=1 Tax=Ancylomarina salipaludis TaxID=2501299 RepID=A0A4Q1JPS5_9BACT|nr:DUF4302 domain-containing protein [Ancylomarina salipaludis]RXQ96724.1 DUF4302 domain-containing protein [Ancylomarina salipaludis]